MERSVNRKDILDNIASHQYAYERKIIETEYDIKIARKIISLYIHFMTEALFRGKNWTLPQRFGKIRIARKHYKAPEMMPFFKSHLKNPEAFNKRVKNPKTPGAVYMCEMTSDFMDKHKCRFRVAKTIRKRMFNELYYDELSNIIK